MHVGNAGDEKDIKKMVANEWRMNIAEDSDPSSTTAKK